MCSKSKYIISCKPYNGNLQLICDLHRLIEEKYADLFLSVFVHGSVATDEIIPYSDFDGLLIIKDEYKNSSCLHSFKKDSLKRIYEFDPLQHHGWFIIFESDLKAYPQLYFPHELFDHSKTIYPTNGFDFTIHLKDYYDYSGPLLKLCNSILNKIENNRPRNMYTLKGFLSQFMLLPALYCQARDEKGIFKKYSFESAKVDFSREEWEVMEKISVMRASWSYDLNTVQRKALTITNRYMRRFLIPAFAPDIPWDLHQELNDTFFNEMKRLINSFRQSLDVSL